MDFHGNNVHQVGYRNPYVMERIKKQMDELCFCPRRYTTPVTVECANKLISLLPPGLNRLLFTPGGTNAIGMAIKLAKIVTGKHKLVSFEDSFHGASLDAIAAGGEEQFKKFMGPLSPLAINIPQPNTYRNTGHSVENLEKLLKQDREIGAFIAETIRNTDVQIPFPDFWKKVREICTRYQVLLILDEIPIAFGRTGKMFAFEHYGIEPDILCLGKGLGAGIIPMAAMIARDEFNIAGDISLGHYTHEKSPLGCAAALALMEYLEKENILKKVCEDENFLQHEFALMKEKHSIIGDIRGIGLLWGVELVKDRGTKEKAILESELVMYECLKGGLSFKVSQGNVLQLSPPLTIRREELKTALDILDLALQKV
jgi:4-aminobutyrate aminotransferase